MPTFEPAWLSRQLELVKITPIVQIKTSYNKHMVQYTGSLETSSLLFRESIVIPKTNHGADGKFDNNGQRDEPKSRWNGTSRDRHQTSHEPSETVHGKYYQSRGTRDGNSLEDFIPRGIEESRNSNLLFLWERGR